MEEGKHWLVGVVDLGGTRVRTAIADREGRLAGRLEEPTDHSRGPDSVIDQITRLLLTSARRASIDWGDVSGVVVAAPGPLNRREGVIYSPPNMPGWETVPLAQRLGAALGTRITVVNDANAAALGEHRFGAGRGTEDMVYLTVSTGIGAGIIAGRRLIEGRSGIAGEIGHTTIDRFGPRCPCGNVGCLEFTASGTSIARRYREASAVKGQSVETVNAAEVARRAAAGDDTAEAVLDDAMRAIGMGVVNLINLLNPEAVVIGGGVTSLGPRLFDTVRQVVARYALPVPKQDARIVPAELGEDVGLIGAAAVALAGEEVTPASATAGARSQPDG